MSTAVATLRASSRVIAVQPWMVKELGLAAIWFAQLLRRMDDTTVLVAPDHSWQAETGLSRDQVARARRKVEEKGWVTCQVRKVAGAPTTHIRLTDAGREAVRSRGGR